MTLPECLNAWLHATGKKQNAIAKKGGLKPSQVSEIAAGKIDPRWSAIEKLAKGLDLSPAQFLAGPPRPEERTGRADYSAVLDELHAQLLGHLDTDAPAEDTAHGDILKAQTALASAQAALARALRRADAQPAPTESHRHVASARR